MLRTQMGTQPFKMGRQTNVDTDERVCVFDSGFISFLDLHPFLGFFLSSPTLFLASFLVVVFALPVVSVSGGGW